MAVLLFKLRNVPDDEADEIRELLHQERIDFYETSAGTFGLSMPGIWLPDEAELPRAKGLIDTYQAQRLQQAREHAGNEPSTLRAHPVRALLFFLAALLVLYLSTAPFIALLP